MFYKPDTGRLSIPLGYILFFGVTLHLAPCVGQVSPVGQLFRDSLYRHISCEYRATLSCRFSYLQGSSVIHTDLNHNSVELARLDSFIRSAISHPELYINRIRLTGYSSIEGSYPVNERLSQDRTQGFYLYLREYYPELYRYPHDLAWVAEDWKGLSGLVKESALNEREEILEIIRKVPGFDEREYLLAKLNGGYPYQQLESEIFPQLRRVEIEIEYSREALNSDNSLTCPPDTDSLSRSDQGISIVIEDWLGIGTIDRSKRKPESNKNNREKSSEYAHDTKKPTPVRFALKTNALLWAGVQPDFTYTVPTANVSLEYYIFRHFSIELGALYSYWRYKSNHAFQGISGYFLEPRYRFSLPLKRERTEVFLGLYSSVGDYDLWEDGAQPVAATGEYWSAGISTGLSFPLIAGLGLELGVRAGYVGANVVNYTREGGYNWFDSRDSYGKVKVTDLNISLVYRFR